MHKKIVSAILAAALTAAAVPAMAENETAANVNSDVTEIFVATDGNDANSGTIDSPFATVQAALDYAVKVKTGNPGAKLSVNIRGGDYYLDSGIKLDTALSGTEDNPFVIQNYDNEKVNLRGSKRINPMDFKQCRDEAVLKKIPEKARQHIGEYDLSELFHDKMTKYKVMNGYSGSQTAYYSIVLNDREQTLARYPDTGYKTVYQKGGKYGFVIEPEITKRWINAKEAVACGWFGVTYAYEEEQVGWFEEDGWVGLLTSTTYGSSEKDRYFIKNLIEELDSPGEYFIDCDNKKLYFYPPYTMTGANIEIPTLAEPMISSNEVNYVTIKGIGLKSTRDHAIVIDKSVGLTIEGCSAQNIGRMVGNFGRADKLRIADCDFMHIGAGVLRVGNGGDFTTLESSQNVIENNHFFDYATTWRAYNPAISLDGVGNTVQHNIFHESSSQGITFRGNDHKILYNEFYNLVKDASDAGAIYAVRTYISRGHEIAYNYFHDIDTSADNSGSIYVAGVYLDDMFSSANVHHNVFSRCNLAVMIGGGRDNKFDNNIITDCENAMFMDARGVGWARYHALPGGQAYGTLSWVDYKSKVWATKYPELASILDHGFVGLPYNNSIQNNLMYNYKVNMIASEMYTYSTVKDNETVTEDPGFVDYKNGNYNLKSNARILRKSPGLAEIDMSKIGLSAERVKEENEKALTAGFRLISPGNGQKNIDNRGYTFKWDKHDGSDKYIVRIADNPQMDNPIIVQETPDNWAIIRNIPTGKKVFWWTVEGINISEQLKNSYKQIGSPRMLISYQYEIVDKTKLESDLDLCQRLYDGITEGTEKGTYKTGFKAKVKEVLDNARAVYNSASSIQLDMDNASSKISGIVAEIPENFNYEVVNMGELLKDKENWLYGGDNNKNGEYWTWNKDGSLSLTGENGRLNHYSVCGYDKDLGGATAVKFGYKVNVSSNYCIMGLQEKPTGFLGNGNGYDLIIKSNQIEIQRCTTGYTGTSIRSQILNFYISDDKWVDLEMGALRVGIGTYVYLKADGMTIASFLDTEAPVWDPEGIKFSFTNPSGSMPECYAEIRAAKD